MLTELMGGLKSIKNRTSKSKSSNLNFDLKFQLR